jgi:biotin operon repressor
MDSKACERISEQTETMIAFANLPDQIRDITKIMEKGTKAQKDLIAIAKFLESDARDLLNPLYSGAIAIFELLCSDQFLAYDEIGMKMNKSPQTAQQTINALKKGGLDLEESPARGYRAKTGRPRIGKKPKRK